MFWLQFCKSYIITVPSLFLTLLIISGLPDSVLQKASAMSNEFEAIYGKHRHGSGPKYSSVNDDQISVMGDILKLVVSSNCLETPKNMDMGLLSVLQQRARYLLVGN